MQNGFYVIWNCIEESRRPHTAFHIKLWKSKIPVIILSVFLDFDLKKKVIRPHTGILFPFGFRFQSFILRMTGQSAKRRFSECIRSIYYSSTELNASIKILTKSGNSIINKKKSIANKQAVLQKRCQVFSQKLSLNNNYYLTFCSKSE